MAGPRQYWLHVSLVYGLHGQPSATVRQLLAAASSASLEEQRDVAVQELMSSLTLLVERRLLRP